MKEAKPPLIQINVDADIPIWIQIRNRILYLIRTGQYKSGDRLPSVRDLAVVLGINFNTVSKAYQDLERDGLICTKRGRGTFISSTTVQAQAFSESPLCVLLAELVNTARSNGIGLDELMVLLDEEYRRNGGS